MVVINSHSIEFRDPAALKLRKRGWRKYPACQIEEAKRQLERTGMVVEPVLVDSEDHVVCGGAIVQAARQLGWTQVPVLLIANMTPDELRLYAVNAHKLNDLGAYDDVLLAEELRELDRLLREDIFKCLAIEEGELTRLLSLGAKEPGSELACNTNATQTVVNRPGDLWQVGRHRLLCASSLEHGSFAALMQGELAQFGLTDSPYNIPMATISSDPTREEFAYGHGEMSPNEFTRFLTTVMRLMKSASEPGAWQAFFMSYHFLLELLRAGTVVFGRPKAMCTWIKSQPGQGTPFRSQTEQVVYFRNGDAPPRDNVQLGKHGRNRSTAWHYDGMTTASSERAELLKSRATPKAVDMLQDAILDVTSHDGIVLDPFGGIGSTMVAAQAAERRGYLIEIEPRFVDVAIRRMQAAYGLTAIRQSDGRSFADLEAEAEAAATRDEVDG
ncbi:DNA modification methylase [Novosphingobium ginsenosidimutans]|uniref:Methyltransferase n=1 Tax=Novosphingobium ginsenosidimutans TaxID=1176536 RepID=A0A5B8S2D0_9SPHN|nr:DNA methyltransferase [Novosphingobium ginsenosidimutans]QEA15629.1 DNA modification methylase [Novosphingobium ginsenosidimutans]